MTALVSYSTGTVSVASGGTTVTGVGSIWSGTNVKPGDLLQIGNFQTVISDVTDTTHLEIPPWGGGAQSGVVYKIWQVSPQRFAGSTAMATVNELVAAFNTSGFFVFVDIADTVPDPSLGDDGQYAFQPTTGKTWAKVAGVWTFLGIYKAFQLLGAWSGATAYAAGDVVTLSGSSYVCVLAHTNHTPPNTTYWQLLASKGDTGATGSTGAAGTNGTNGAGYGGTSATSLLIANSVTKVFTTQAGLAYQVGNYVRASSAANGSNYMEGTVSAYSGTSLSIAVTAIGGSGTFADWTFSVAGAPGNVGVASIAGNTGAFTLSNGITNSTNDIRLDTGNLPGVATNSNAAAGKLGEYIESIVLIGSAVTLANSTAKDITSISLTAGDWDVTGNAWINTTGTISLAASWVSSTSATLPTPPAGGMNQQRPGASALISNAVAGQVRFSLSGTTTVYLSTLVTFTTGATAYGIISARRVR